MNNEEDKKKRPDWDKCPGKAFFRSLTKLVARFLD